MRLHVKTLLPCTIEQAWTAIQSTVLLMEVTPGGDKMSVVEPNPMPERWTDARRTVLRLPGVGERVIEIEFMDCDRHVVQTLEKDVLVKLWRHRMEVSAGPGGQAFYSDTVDIEAGVFTLPVYALAQFLYRYRHRGWLKIAKRLTGQSRRDQG